MAIDITSELSSITDQDWMGMDWVRELKNNVTTVEELERYLPLGADPKDADELRQVTSIHPMNIPRYYLSLIDPADPADPVRRMCVPQAQELVVAGSMGETTKDPYGDDKHDKGNGVLHKYSYTALVVATEFCAMYCRHCFRKRMVGLPNDQTVRNFRAALDYVAAHTEITNLIVSGGDALMLPTSVLRDMLLPAGDIEHLNFIRLASRAPVTYPLRFFDDALMDLVAELNAKKAVYVPTHFNHPNEITPVAAEAVRRLRMAGVTVNNQAVLLRGVNDDPDTLETLMNKLLRIGINPYYLYQCMPVARVRHHFQVPLKSAVDMVDQARSRLDGYGKRFKFIIGHDIGKLEICGRVGNKVLLKQIHARTGFEEESSRILVRELNETGGWLDDLAEADL